MGHIDDNVYLGLHINRGAISIEIRHHHGIRELDRTFTVPRGKWGRLRDAALRDPGGFARRIAADLPDLAEHLQALPDGIARLADLHALVLELHSL